MDPKHIPKERLLAQRNYFFNAAQFSIRPNETCFYRERTRRPSSPRLKTGKSQLNGLYIYTQSRTRVLIRFL